MWLYAHHFWQLLGKIIIYKIYENWKNINILRPSSSRDLCFLNYTNKSALSDAECEACMGCFQSVQKEEMDFLSMFKYRKKKGQHTTTNTAYKTEYIIKQGSKNNRQTNLRRAKSLYSWTLRQLLKLTPSLGFLETESKIILSI